LLKIQEKIRGRVVKPQALRKVVANSTTEHSSPDSDNDISKKPAPGTNKVLKEIVNEPEVPAVDEKAPTIVNDDQREVKKVTEDKDAAETRSSSSVELSDLGEEKKLEIQSDEDIIAKETDYDKAKEKAKSASEEKVSIEEDAVIETSYDDPEKTDISTSTQAQVEEKPAKTKSTRKKSTSTKKKSDPKKSDEDMLDSIVVEEGRNSALDQDGVVVKKGSKVEVEGNINDIDSTLTIGGSDEGDDGGVTFSSNDVIDEGEATFSSSGEDSPVEITEDNATVIVDSDGDIDVSALLDNL
jgi:hypothetical protein